MCFIIPYCGLKCNHKQENTPFAANNIIRGDFIMERPMKRPSSSRAESVYILMPEHINGAKRLFGGRLMEWIDIVAAVVARRHSGYDVTTACVDSLEFLHPAFVNSTLTLVGRITYVGNTSMEVRVDTYVEELDGTRKSVNVAYLVLVAIDADGKPAQVPGLILETEEEKAEFAAGKKRSQLRKEKKCL